MSLSSRLWHTDELIRARHVQCRPHNHVCRFAEAAAANTVAFPLRGVFVKHLDDGREVVAHPGQAVFFNVGEIHRVSHPHGGDDCFVLELAEPGYRWTLAELAWAGAWVAIPSRPRLPWRTGLIHSSISADAPRACARCRARQRRRADGGRAGGRIRHAQPLHRCVSRTLWHHAIGPSAQRLHRDGTRTAQDFDSGHARSDLT